MVKKSKYSIVKGKTGKSKKVVVMGKEKELYKKIGSTAMYVLSNGRHIRLSVYKKRKYSIKYSECRNKNGELKIENVMGDNKIFFKKKGTNDIYVSNSKGSYIKLSTYKKRKMKMLNGNTEQDRGAKRRRKGGNNMLSNLMEQNQDGGAKKRRRKRRTKK